MGGASPELGVVAEDGDRLRHVEGILQDELHVFGGAQAGVEQVLGGDGLAQHAGDGLRLPVVVFQLNPFGSLGLLRLILRCKNKTQNYTQTRRVAPIQYIKNTRVTATGS